MRFIYLHGFASSPASRKARFFADKLGEQGISLEVLDLAPHFRDLTITSQLEIMENSLKGHPSVLIGASMGGYLASLYATYHPEVDRVVLLAPAFDFYRLRTQQLGPMKLNEWRENGTIAVYHYGMGRETELGFGLMEDVKNYPGVPAFTQPCLIHHGLKDEVVPFGKSAGFVASRPDSRLISHDSGHELTDVLDEIWRSSKEFLLSGDLL